ASRSCWSWRGSTTNSLASTGIETAARTARRSSTEPPNQCGSHRTEIAAAPPASSAPAPAPMSSPGPPATPGCRRDAFDLRDQVEAGRGEAGEDRPGRRRGLCDGEVVVERQPAHLLADVL